jgi:hypothetical protein
MLFAVLSLGGYAASWQFHASEPAPRLRVEKTVHDFGLVAPRSILQAQFTLFNEGSARVVVNPGNAGCNCGEPPSRTLVIAPGAAAELQIPFRAPDKSGPAEKRVACATSDRQTPQFTLTLRATIRREPVGLAAQRRGE